MKKFLIRIVLFVLATVAILESMFLFMLSLGRITVNDVISFYNFSLGSPKELTIIKAIAGAFLLLGFVLFTLAFKAVIRQA